MCVRRSQLARACPLVAIKFWSSLNSHLHNILKRKKGHNKRWIFTFSILLDPIKTYNFTLIIASNLPVYRFIYFIQWRHFCEVVNLVYTSTTIQANEWMNEQIELLLLHLLFLKSCYLYQKYLYHTIYLRDLSSGRIWESSEFFLHFK